MAMILFAIFLILTEIAARELKPWLAAGPDDLSRVSAYAAKLAAVRDLKSEHIAILGDSVALGSVLDKHGYTDWRDKNLSAALTNVLRKSGQSRSITNFAINGARPTDLKAIFDDLVAVGTRQFVIVIGLRGFSQDFEAETERRQITWAENICFDCGGAICYRLDTATAFDAALSQTWYTRGALALIIPRLLNGKLPEVLSNWRVGGRIKTAEDDLLLTLQAGQRFATSEVSPERAQTQALIALFETAKDVDAKIILAYATENPDYIESLAPTPRIKAGREALAAIAEDFPNHVFWLGPDGSVTYSDYVDFVHPSPEGYEKMAQRIISTLSID